MTAITHGRLNFIHPSRTPNRATRRAAGPVRRITDAIRVWRRRIREREALLQLSDHDRRDIGVTPADIAWEMSQPFWREPRQR